MDPGGYGAPLPVILTLRAGSNRHEVPNLEPSFDPSPPRTPAFTSPPPPQPQHQASHSSQPPVPHGAPGPSERKRTNHPIGFATISG